MCVVALLPDETALGVMTVSILAISTAVISLVIGGVAHAAH
jgi:hypothetical protein